MLLEQEFPQLGISGYQITSPGTNEYNCIAWAAHDTTRFWWPTRVPPYYWPEKVPFEETVDAFVQAFSVQGYKRCPTSELEPGFEKVAIYVVPNGIPKHAARQLISGRWTSKLGRNVDIEHSLEGLVGTTYGTVGCILRRPINRS